MSLSRPRLSTGSTAALVSRRSDMAVAITPATAAVSNSRNNKPCQFLDLLSVGTSFGQSECRFMSLLDGEHDLCAHLKYVRVLRDAANRPEQPLEVEAGWL